MLNRNPSAERESTNRGLALMDTTALSGYLGLAESTINKFRLSGNGPAFIKIGRRVLYSQDDVDAWILKQRRQSTSE